MSSIFFAKYFWASDRIYWKKLSSVDWDGFILLQIDLNCMLWEWESLRSIDCFMSTVMKCFNAIYFNKFGTIRANIYFIRYQIHFKETLK